jgi:hypothetical protein
MSTAPSISSSGIIVIACDAAACRSERIAEPGCRVSSFDGTRHPMAAKAAGK